MVAGHFLQEQLELGQEFLANETLYVLQAPDPRAKGADGLEEMDHGVRVGISKATGFLTSSSV